MLSDVKLSPGPLSPLGLRPSEPSQHLSSSSTNNRLLSSENRVGLTVAAPLIDTRVRKRHLGRIRKVEADLELLAAKPLNALKTYNEAITHLKLTNDLVWWAAALEGSAVAKMLSLLAGLELKNGLQEILDALESAVETYSKALPKAIGGTVANGSQEVVEPLVFVESVVRLINFKLELADVEVEQLGREQLQVLLGNHLVRRNHPRRPKPFPHDVRLDINRLASMVELAVDGLRFVEDRIRALSKLIGAFESIGFSRKAAWFKRELVGVVIEQIAKFGGSIPQMGQEELIKLMWEVCSSLKISMDSSTREPIVINHRPDVIIPVIPGWRDLQLGVLTDAVIACHELKESVSELNFRFKMNELLYSHQPHRLDIIVDRRINALLKSLSHHPRLNYWGPKDIILTIELIPLSSRHAPITYHKRPLLQGVLQPAHSDTTARLLTPTFYYNHNRTPTRLSKDGKLPSLKVVKDEPVYVTITLQNSLSFDLDVSMICLSTSGISFEAIKTQVVISAQTIQTIMLTGIPLSVGTLKIKGCHIQLLGCSEPQEFVLPVGKPKQRKAEAEEEEVLSCEVVDCLPFLRIVSGYDGLVNSGGLIVHDGEMTTIDIKLINTSKARADWLDVAVSDNLSDEMRKKLDESSQQHSELDRYQIEHELVDRPLLSVTWSSSVEGRGTGWIKLKCLGKAGCRSVSVSIDYGIESTNLRRRLDWSIGLCIQKSLHLVGFEALPGGLVVIKIQNLARGGQVFEVEAQGGKVPSTPFFRNSLKQILQPGGTHSFFIEIEPIQITQTEAARAIPTLIDRQFVIPHHEEARPISNPDSGRKGNLDDSPSQNRVLVDQLRFWVKDKLLRTIRMDWRELGTNKSGEVNLRAIDVTPQMIPNMRLSEVSVEMDFSSDCLKAKHRGSKPAVDLQIDEFYSVQIKTRNHSGTKREVKTFIKVIGLDGMSIPASNKQNQFNAGQRVLNALDSVNYLVEGLLNTTNGGEEAFDETDGLHGMGSIMLEENEKEEGIEFGICFLTRGTFLIQALVSNVPPPPQHNRHPELELLGSSDLIQFTVF